MQCKSLLHSALSHRSATRPTQDPGASAEPDNPVTDYEKLEWVGDAVFDACVAHDVYWHWEATGRDATPELVSVTQNAMQAQCMRVKVRTLAMCRGWGKEQGRVKVKAACINCTLLPR